MSPSRDQEATTIQTPYGDLPYQSLEAWRQAGNNGAGWSQARLAARAREVSGISVTEDTVANIERLRARPTYDTAVALARALGVLVEQIRFPSPEQVAANTGSRRSRYARLLELYQEALRRLPAHPEWRQVDPVQDSYFNLIAEATGLPRRITSREDLDTWMPEREQPPKPRGSSRAR